MRRSARGAGRRTRSTTTQERPPRHAGCGGRTDPDRRRVLRRDRSTDRRRRSDAAGSDTVGRGHRRRAGRRGDRDLDRRRRRDDRPTRGAFRPRARAAVGVVRRGGGAGLLRRQGAPSRVRSPRPSACGIPSAVLNAMPAREGRERSSSARPRRTRRRSRRWRAASGVTTVRVASRTLRVDPGFLPRVLAAVDDEAARPRSRRRLRGRGDASRSPRGRHRPRWRRVWRVRRDRGQRQRAGSSASSATDCRKRYDAGPRARRPGRLGPGDGWPRRDRRRASPRSSPKSRLDACVKALHREFFEGHGGMKYALVGYGKMGRAIEEAATVAGPCLRRHRRSQRQADGRAVRTMRSPRGAA